MAEIAVAPFSAKTPGSDGLVEYEAICHCKAVRYRTRLPPKLKVNNCSCSVCTKFGYLLVYPMKADTEWISGYDNLVDYQMGPKTQDHKFCKTCGSSIGIDSKKDFWRFNVRLFRDFHELDLDITKHDGVTFNEEYNDPELA